MNGGRINLWLVICMTCKFLRIEKSKYRVIHEGLKHVNPSPDFYSKEQIEDMVTHNITLLNEDDFLNES